MKRKFKMVQGTTNMVQGYLYYDTDTKTFSMRLLPNPPHRPDILFDMLLKQGIIEVPAKIVKNWVDARVFPPERQGIKGILQAMGLSKYDEFDILMYNDGVSHRDSTYLVEVPYDE